jgi:hypothetical protein
MWNLCLFGEEGGIRTHRDPKTNTHNGLIVH